MELVARRKLEIETCKGRCLVPMCWRKTEPDRGTRSLWRLHPASSASSCFVRDVFNSMLRRNVLPAKSGLGDEECVRKDRSQLRKESALPRQFPDKMGCMRREYGATKSRGYIGVQRKGERLRQGMSSFLEIYGGLSEGASRLGTIEIHPIHPNF